MTDFLSRDPSVAPRADGRRLSRRSAIHGGVGAIAGLCLGVLSGCGSANRASHGASIDRSSRVSITVHWPPASRVIPLATARIEVEILQNDVVVGAATLQPSGLPSEAETYVIGSLPPGEAVAVARAYPVSFSENPNATASGSAPLVLRAGEVTVFEITMASTAVRLEVTRSVETPTFPNGGGSVSVSGFDAEGRLILIYPYSVEVESLTPDIVSVGETNSSNFDTRGVGDALLRVTHSDSGLQVLHAFHVGPHVSINAPSGGPSFFVSVGLTERLTARVEGISDQSVLWSVLDADGGTIDATGLYTAPRRAGTFRISATSVGDPTGRATVLANVVSGSASGTID